MEFEFIRASALIVGFSINLGLFIWTGKTKFGIWSVLFLIAYTRMMDAYNGC